MIVKVAADGWRKPPLSLRRAKTIVSKVLKCERKSINGELHIIFVDNRRIRLLNRLYHRNNSITDVIAFGYPPMKNGPSAPDSPWADIYISVPVARSSAKRYDVPLEQELTRLIVHGLLHLFGHDDHEKTKRQRMWKTQEALVSALFKKRHGA